MNRADIIALIERWQESARKNKPVQIVFSEVQEAIECLLSELGEGREDDPFKNLNETLIRQFSLILRNLNQHLMSIHSFKEFYQKCVELELITGRRIHKGDTLHWIGRYYLELKDYENGFRYSILTFLDDTISEKQENKNANGEICISNSMNAPICQLLQLYFHMPKVNLKNLKDNAFRVLDKNPDIHNPELLIFKMREEGYQIPRYSDYRYYHPSYPYLREQYDRIKETDDSTEWEKFAAFLFSSVEGFEPILDVKPGHSSYQFDVVIRNVTPHDFSISWLGEYFAIECKYYGKKSVGTEVLDHFASKLKYHDFKCGIIFTKTPISGWKTKSGEVAGRLVQTKIFNRQGLIIFDLSKEDIESILDGRNLIEVLIEKYEKVRLEL